VATLRWEKFYPRKWQSDAALRCCSAGARGVWIELVCIMYQQEPEQKGYLAYPGRITEPLTDSVILRLSGLLEKEYFDGIRELEKAGVFSRTPDGVIFCRHIVEEAKKSITNAQNGAKGGNPRLTDGLTDSVKRNGEKSDKPRIKNKELRDKKEEREREEGEKTAPEAPTRADIATQQKTGKKTEQKKRYGGGDRVQLSEEQFVRLVEDYGLDPLWKKIEELDMYIQRLEASQQGRKKLATMYSDHNLTIRAWFLKDGMRRAVTPQQKKAQEKEEADRRAAVEEKVKEQLIAEYNRKHGIVGTGGDRTYEPTSDEVQMALNELESDDEDE